MSRLISRQIFHNPSDILNVMQLTFTKGMIGSPHFNKDRDEVIVIIRGSLQLLIYSDDLDVQESVNLFSNEHENKWYRIPKNVIHQFNILENNTQVLELIGGHFFDGACVEVVS